MRLGVCRVTRRDTCPLRAIPRFRRRPDSTRKRNNNRDSSHDQRQRSRVRDPQQRQQVAQALREATRGSSGLALIAIARDIGHPSAHTDRGATIVGSWATCRANA